MKFRTPYEFGCDYEFVTQPGELSRPTFKAVLLENGIIDLIQDGVEMTYEKIQSFADSVDINVIVKRFMAGDAYALEQAATTYGDFVSVPSSYMEVLNTIVEAKNAYEMNSKDISFDEFIKKALMPVSEDSEHIVKKEENDEQKSE